MITKRPWFGPKRNFGWGWTPVSWQGWLATLVFAIAAIGARVYFGPTAYSFLAVVGCIAVLVAVMVLTGTKPGGPGSS